MKLPLKVFLKSGNVLRGPFKLPDGYQDIRRIIILTNNNQDTFLFVNTTSQPPNKQYRKDDIYIPKGNEKSFILPTYIKMNKVFEHSTEKIKNKHEKGLIEILDPISEALLNKIYEAIKDSEVIKQKYIKRILDERIQ